MPDETKEIIKTPETGIVRNDFLAQAGGDDFLNDMQSIDDALQENIELGEIQISRISIAQPGDSRSRWKRGRLAWRNAV
jgi:hypothetical protein